MATKGLKPMGEGMYMHAAGAWGYHPNLPGTITPQSSQEVKNAGYDDQNESALEASKK